jgi:hypothetical protein
MTAADRALARLRDPNDPAIDQLSRQIADQVVAVPLSEVASARWIASQITAALEAGTRGPAFREWLVRQIEAERGRWAADPRPLRDLVPADVVAPLREVLARPWSPSEDLAFRVLDQAAIRTLVRDVLVEMLQRFRVRVGKVDGGLLGGLGKQAVQRGRGILGGLRENLGGVADGLVGAVKEEVEFALDSKVRDFARQATSDVVRLIARDLAQQDRAAAFAETRLGILDVLLDTPRRELADEAARLQPEQAVESIAAAIRVMLTRHGFADDLTGRVQTALDGAGDGTLGAWLREVGLDAVWTEATAELLGRHLRRVVATDAFAGWWEELHRK